MTKQEIAQELKKEFEKGYLKPSQLKRSKSASDISVKEVKPLSRSKSAPELEPINQKETMEQWENKVSILELKLETQALKLSQTKQEYNSLAAQHQSLKD